MKNSLFIPVLCSLTGCATIVNTPLQEVGISSHPSNACVYVDHYHIGFTPVIVELTRCNNHIVRIELEGYQPYEVVLTRGVSGWVVGNLVFGGLIGIAIDAISGGIFVLTPEQVQAHLRADNVSFSPSPECSVSVVLEAHPEWQKIGSLR